MVVYVSGCRRGPGRGKPFEYKIDGVWTSKAVVLDRWDVDWLASLHDQNLGWPVPSEVKEARKHRSQSPPAPASSAGLQDHHRHGDYHEDSDMQQQPRIGQQQHQGADSLGGRGYAARQAFVVDADDDLDGTINSNAQTGNGDGKKDRDFDMALVSPAFHLSPGYPSLTSPLGKVHGDRSNDRLSNGQSRASQSTSLLTGTHTRPMPMSALMHSALQPDLVGSGPSAPTPPGSTRQGGHHLHSQPDTHPSQAGGGELMSTLPFIQVMPAGEVRHCASSSTLPITQKQVGWGVTEETERNTPLSINSGLDPSSSSPTRGKESACRRSDFEMLESPVAPFQNSETQHSERQHSSFSMDSTWSSSPSSLMAIDERSPGSSHQRPQHETSIASKAYMQLNESSNPVYQTQQQQNKPEQPIDEGQSLMPSASAAPPHLPKYSSAAAVAAAAAESDYYSFGSRNTGSILISPPPSSPLHGQSPSQARPPAPHPPDQQQQRQQQKLPRSTIDAGYAALQARMARDKRYGK